MVRPSFVAINPWPITGNNFIRELLTNHYRAVIQSEPLINVIDWISFEEMNGLRKF